MANKHEIKKREISPEFYKGDCKKLARCTGSRALDMGNGVNAQIKVCVDCGREMYTREPKSTKPGNMAAFMPLSPELCQTCPKNDAAGQRYACIDCRNAKWALPLGEVRVEGGSKRGAVAKGSVNTNRSLYVLPTKASNWLAVEGPCQAVTLGVEKAPWERCKACYVKRLRHLAQMGVSAEIVKRRKGSDKIEKIKSDTAVKQAARNALTMLGKSIKEKAPIASLPNIVKTYRFEGLVIKKNEKPYLIPVEARNQSDARTQIAAELGQENFTGRLYKRHEDNSLQELV